jgi:hypothetical protein
LIVIRRDKPNASHNVCDSLKSNHYPRRISARVLANSPPTSYVRSEKPIHNVKEPDPHRGSQPTNHAGILTTILE